MAWFERLSTLDATFLALEDPTTPMHVGAVVVLDAAPLALDHGGVDFDRVCAYIEGAIARVPRYRQRLAFGPSVLAAVGQPVWVDDDRFNIHYHVRHTALPRPGDVRQLKRLAGRIFSQRLDRDRPLWEIWVVEGLDGDRVALITKVHHAMVDGMAGVGLMAALLKTSPDATVRPSPPWEPRPAPRPAELIAAEVRHRATGTRALWERVRGAASAGGDLLGRARGAASALADTLVEGVTPASRTPLWGDLGPHRRFDIAHTDLADAKAIKASLGGKVNDVVLAAVTGGLRRFFARRGADLDAIDDFRAFVPVSVRKQDHHGKLGNRVSMMLAHLPIAEADLLARYAAVLGETARLKADPHQVQSGELFADLGDWTGAGLIANTAKLVRHLRPYNIVVTNVPGPPFPLYLLGARMREVYPLVPLFGHGCVGVAIFSYAGGLFWGFNADWQAVPDLHDLVGDVEAELADLRAAAAG